MNRFMLLADDITISGGVSTPNTYNFASKNVQKLVMQVDSAVLGEDFTIQVKSGARSIIDPIQLQHLQVINGAQMPIASGASADNVITIDLGSQWLDDEELQVVIQNNTAATDLIYDLIVFYGADEPEEALRYVKIVDNAFSLHNVKEIWFCDDGIAAAAALDENDIVMTVTDEHSSMSEKVKTFWAATVSDTFLGDIFTTYKSAARVWSDSNGLLQKVSINCGSAIASDQYFVAILDDTEPHRALKVKTQQAMAISSKITSLSPESQAANEIREITE